MLGMFMLELPAHTYSEHDKQQTQMGLFGGQKLQRT